MHEVSDGEQGSTNRERGRERVREREGEGERAESKRVRDRERVNVRANEKEREMESVVSAGAQPAFPRVRNQNTVGRGAPPSRAVSTFVFRACE
jgi:hypothetical protein